jgi:tripartite-type tricarboxylate transporter receptor subunit TctC
MGRSKHIKVPQESKKVMSEIARRRVLALGASGVFASAAFDAAAASFPSWPITIAIGNAAGGPTDALMRAMAPHLSERLGQPIVIENRAGASEIPAAQFVSKAPPDGYTLLMAAAEAPLTMNQFLFRKLLYDQEREFSPVSLLLSAPLVLAVPANSPANSIEEFIDLARRRGRDQPVAYGSAGAGTPIHLPMVTFAKQNDLTLIHVSYCGLAPALTELIAGRIDAVWGGLAAVRPSGRCAFRSPPFFVQN